MAKVAKHEIDALELLTLKDAAGLSGVSGATVRRWVDDPSCAVTGVAIGHQRYVCKAALLEHLGPEHDRATRRSGHKRSRRTQPRRHQVVTRLALVFGALSCEEVAALPLFFGVLDLAERLGVPDSALRAWLTTHALHLRHITPEREVVVDRDGLVQVATRALAAVKRFAPHLFSRPRAGGLGSPAELPPSHEVPGTGRKGPRPVRSRPEHAMTVVEAAALAGVADSTIYRWLDAPGTPVREIRVARRRLVDEDSLREFLGPGACAASQRTAGATPPDVAQTTRRRRHAGRLVVCVSDGVFLRRKPGCPVGQITKPGRSTPR